VVLFSLVQGDGGHHSDLEGGRIMAQRTYSVSGVARRFGVAPRVISNLFYRRLLSDGDCPVVDGRRVIPAHYVGTIESLLRDRGLIPATPPTASR
jgi:hypothetical protein